MKKCPYCAEDIQEAAIKCKHCGTELNQKGKADETVKIAKISETLGLIMLFVPLASSFMLFFWVGGMNLLEAPWSKFNLLAAITILVTAILATIESSQLGAGSPSDLNRKGVRNSGPVGWFFAIFLLWFIAYPTYLYIRRNYGLKNYLIPGILITVIFVGSLFIMGININKSIRDAQQQLENLSKGITNSQYADQFMQVAGQQTTVDYGANAQQALWVLAIACESFATVNNGKYPSRIEELLNSQPPFINQNICNKTLNEYGYICNFSNSGYKFIGKPKKEGYQTFVITTGGILMVE